jgi:uncharacterized protein YbjT (DUF2867 family)
MALVTVLGANGVQGLAQIRQLRNAGYQLRGISRHQSETLAAMTDVEFRAADIFDETTLPAAFEGSDAVFINHPVAFRTERPGMLAAVGRAAKAVGVARVVWNTASWIPDRPGDAFSYVTATDGVNALFRSGVPATVFGSVLFMDNLQTGFARQFIVEEDRFHYPHQPQMLANWISLDDVAKYMIAALARPDLEGAWMNIGGPERLGPQRVAEILSDAAGRTIRYDPASPEAFGWTLANALGDGVPQERKQAFADYIRDFYVYNNTAPTRPFQVNVDAVRERMPEVELETMAEWARRQDWSKPAG